ncbi:MAG: ribosome-binding factor A, partial [Nitrospirota bacterium]
AVGFVRTELGRRLNLRYTPELVFYRDTSAEYGNRMEKLLDSLHEESEETGETESSSSPINKSESIDG